jgi:hypothetical protein
MFDVVVPTNGGDWGVVVRSWVVSDLANNGNGCLDWVQRHVTQCNLGCLAILFIFFLHFECDVEAVGVFM